MMGQVFPFSWEVEAGALLRGWEGREGQEFEENEDPRRLLQKVTFPSGSNSTNRLTSTHTHPAPFETPNRV